MINKVKNAIIVRMKLLYNCLGGGNNVQGISLLRRLSNFTILGIGNMIEVKSKIPKDVNIVIYGNNHKLVVEENVTFKRGIIWFEDHNCEIRIGSGTTIESANLAVAEGGTQLIIGKDCMISSNVHISTTDSHSIIDIDTGIRTNPSQNVVIGNHVWLGNSTSINKGVVIGNNAVVAGHSVVTKPVAPNSIVAGIPARTVKNNITWDRNRI